jgi:hypothetical protein
MRLRVSAILLSQALFIACTPENTLHGDPDPVDDPEETDIQAADEPIADAGADQEVSPLLDVQLNGIASYDPGNLPITRYQWTLVQVPAGSTAALTGADQVNPKFFADIAGEYIAELTVMNDAGVWDTTPDRVTITAKPLQGFYVQLTWDTRVDLDIHLLNGSAPLWDDPGDACFCNTNPDWGQIGNSIDDPSLDWDVITEGFGPETITIQSPQAGSYGVQVHYYSSGGESSDVLTNAKIDVYLDGALFRTLNGSMSSTDSVWDVGALTWPAGTWSDHNTYTYTSGSCGWSF